MSVKVVEVEKTYKLGENKVHALRGVNLELKKVSLWLLRVLLGQVKQPSLT